MMALSVKNNARCLILVNRYLINKKPEVGEL